MSLDFKNILKYFSGGYSPVAFLVFTGTLITLAFFIFVLVNIIGRKTQPFLLWPLLRIRAFAILLVGFTLHLANVYIYMRFDFFETYRYHSLGILTIWLFSIYAFFELGRILRLLKQAPYMLTGTGSSRSFHSANKIGLINSVKFIFLLWFVFLVPYLLVFMIPYFTPNYALVFDNSLSMEQSVEDAKSFVKKEFTDAFTSKTEFIITKIPRNEKFEKVINEFQTRLNRENAQTGVIRISLKWDNLNDLDLYCIEPNNNKIYFKNKISRTGGTLDVDMNAGGRTSNKPIENIYFGYDKGLPGKYKIFVDFFSKKTAVSNNIFDILLDINNSLYLLTGSIGDTNEDASVIEFNYIPNKIPNLKDFILGSNIKITSLNNIQSISDVVSTNASDLNAHTFHVNSKESFIDSINNMQADGIGSPISQLLKQNYAECLEYFGKKSTDNHCIIITDGEDESLINGIYNGENFILEYENLTGKEVQRPIDFFKNIDFVVYQGASNTNLNLKLHDLAAKNKNVKVHIINNSENSSNQIFQNIFKNIIIEWEYLFVCVFPIFLFGIMLQLKSRFK